MERSAANGSRPLVCFEVEKVIGISDNGNYQVQWAPSWVSRYQLVGCEHLIQDFLEHQGEEEKVLKVYNQPNLGFSAEPGSLPTATDDLTLYNGKVEQPADHSNASATDIQNFPVEPSSRNVDSTEFEQLSSEHETFSGMLPNEVDAFIKIEWQDEQGSQGGEEVSGASTALVESHLNLDTPSSTATNSDASMNVPKGTSKILQNYHNAVLHKEYSSSIIDNQNTKNSASTTRSVKPNARNKSFPCVYCGKNFMASGALKLHIRTHTGEKPFHCDHCGKSFTRSTHLKRHQRLHTGETPYGCNVCGKRFKQWAALSYHSKRCFSTSVG